MTMKYALAAAMLCAWAMPAQAQMVRAQDPAGVLRALEAAGLEGEMDKDGEGDPMIASKIDGTNFRVIFYNCTNHQECATIQFHTAYSLTTPVTLDKINAWNRRQRFGRAYLDDENDPVLQMDVDLDDGGMSTELFTDNVEFWQAIVANFEEHIGF
jgi:hypothetical protein